MVRLKSHIVNELGRDIRVMVSIEKNGFFNLTLEGPDSTSENIITPMEARTLCDLLGRALQQST